MIELMPLSKDSLLISRKLKISALHLMLNLVNEAIGACGDFLNEKYIAFDAQVGETSCQIRAYKICLLAQNKQFISEIQDLIPRLIKYKNSVAAYISIFENSTDVHSKYLKELDHKEINVTFFNKIENNLILKDDCLFIILAHFLYKYCIFNDNIPNAINYNLIKKSLNIGSTPARNLANHYQAVLSRLSCDFILQQSNYTNEMNAENNYLFLKSLLRIGDRKRQILPYYYITKILLSSGTTSSLSIIISICDRTQEHVQPMILFFKKDHTTNKIILKSTLNDFEQHMPAIVFRGSVLEDKPSSLTNFKDNILKFGVKEIILFNAASHPQYAGEILQDYVTNPYKDIISINKNLEELVHLNAKELNYARIESEAIGCSRGNSSLFYIKHIFCSTFLNEYKTLSYKG